MVLGSKGMCCFFWNMCCLFKTGWRLWPPTRVIHINLRQKVHSNEVASGLEVWVFLWFCKVLTSGLEVRVFLWFCRVLTSEKMFNLLPCPNSIRYSWFWSGPQRQTRGDSSLWPPGTVTKLPSGTSPRPPQNPKIQNPHGESISPFIGGYNPRYPCSIQFLGGKKAPFISTRSLSSCRSFFSVFGGVLQIDSWVFQVAIKGTWNKGPPSGAIKNPLDRMLPLMVQEIRQAPVDVGKYPIVYWVFYIPGGCLGFLNHQQYLRKVTSYIIAWIVFSFRWRPWRGYPH